MPTTPNLTVNGTLESLLGAAVNGASVLVQLCGYGPMLPRINGTALLASLGMVTIDCPLGTFSVALYGNDQILPAGTFYTFTLLDAQKNVVQTAAYQLSGAAGTVIDLSTKQQYDADGAGVDYSAMAGNAAAPYRVVGYAATPVFDAGRLLVVAIEITLRGNVTASSLINAAVGALVTFIIVQDVSGGHTLAWPAQVMNHGIIDDTPLAINAQTFVVRNDGNLYPVGPLTIF